MKKTKSDSLIKVNSLAASTKRSMQLQSNNKNTQRLMTTRSICNLGTMKPLKLLYDQQTQATSNNQNVNLMVKPATLLKNKVETLHKAIDKLESEIRHQKQKGKNKSKDYETQLKNYQQTNLNISKLDRELKKTKQRLFEIKNTICMLHQDFSSTQLNIKQGLAQKQYCDEILQQYERQYENQSVLVLQMLDKQYQNGQIKQHVRNMQQQLKRKQVALNEWKKQMQYDLQQKIIKNKLTQLRIDLMKAQQQANQYAQKNKLIKFRQILCTCIKQHAQRNKIVITSQMLNQEGMQIYICKIDGISQFQQQVLGYRGRQKSKYDIQIAQKYFGILSKIQLIINNVRHKQNRKINKQYLQQISSLHKQMILKQQKLSQNERKIVQIKENIEIVFANQSVAVIQYLRQSTGRYQISEIKSKLKILKEQQKQRINKITNIYKQYKTLSKNNFQLNSVDFMNSLSQLTIERQKIEAEQKQLQHKIKKLSLQKENIENLISKAVSNWGQLSCKKLQLRQLYKQLSKLNSEIRQAEKLCNQQKQHRTLTKPLTRSDACKKSEFIAKTMRQTLKLRVNGSLPRNKQNQVKLTNRLQRDFKKSQQIDDNWKTLKQSLDTQFEMPIKNFNKKTDRFAKDSLTALLMSKFAI